MPQLKKFCYYVRVVLAFALLMAMLSFFNGCSSHKKPSSYSDYKEIGMASYYHKQFHSGKTASGQIFNNNSMTAAHKTLPFGTNVVVKNLNNGKSIKVTINDRGPFIHKRIIDLTKAAFAKIENLDKGLAKVEIMVE